jgi:hypothetical protein
VGECTLGSGSREGEVGSRLHVLTEDEAQMVEAALVLPIKLE